MLNTFQWMAEGCEMPRLDFCRLQDWIQRVAADHGRRAGELTYIFCDDERIIEVNRQFLSHDYYTDIITFDYTHGRVVSGDMYISLDTVRSNAEAVGAAYDDELLRVIIHGVLHLCGINDKGPGEREIMEAAEDCALNMLRDHEV
ncbi:MAG: rRNA maturation RNase YbeY [Bacteroides sp.]|nr:rRNA maturation RNase YbeY [Bacteroides sp.]MCM1095363.1 rRNA maturation RNase YbeY [Terasakiella sp.]